MSKLISVIEEGNHIECIESICQVFKYLKNYQLNLFLPRALLKQLQKEYGNYKFYDLDNSLVRNNLGKLLKPSSLVFIETLQKNLSFYSQLKLVVPVLLRIHNVNAWLCRKKLYYANIIYLLKVIFRDNILNQEAKYRDIILKKINYVNFCDGTIRDYVVVNKMINSNKILYFPAGIFYNTGKKFPKNVLPRIVIPGTVEKKRRDYQLIIRALQKAVRLNNQLKLEIILLGKANSAEAVKIINNLKNISGNIKIIFYKNDVPQSEFKKIMTAADLMLAPIILKTAYSCYSEYYSLSKSSGQYNDAVRYGLTGVFPAAYRTDAKLNGLYEKYKNLADLVRIILKYSDSKYCFRKKENNRKLLLSYNRQVIRKITKEFRKVI